MSILPVRIYFDFGDYRSYFLMKVVESWGNVPADFEWVAIDGQGLRSMSGSFHPDDGQLQREYRILEADRYAGYHGIAFVRPEGNISGSMATRIYSWVQEHHPDSALSFVRKVLYFVWGEGHSPTQSLLTMCLESLGLNAENAWVFSSQKDSFLHQDRMLQEALASEVFDVPVVCIDGERFLGYENADLVRGFLVRRWLERVDVNRMKDLLAQYLLGSSRDDFDQAVCGLHVGSESRESDSGLKGAVLSAEALSGERPGGDYYIPVVPPGSQIAGLCFPVSGQSFDSFVIDSYSGCVSGQLGIASGPISDVDDFGSLSAQFKKLRANGGSFLAPVHHRGVLQLLQICGNPGGDVELILHKDGVFIFNEWRIGCVLFEDGTADPVLARRVVAEGCHILISGGRGSDLLSDFCALGMSCARWVLGFQESGVVIVDADGHYVLCREFFEGLSPGWPAHFEPGVGKVYSGEMTRRVLLREESLSIGSSSLGGEIEFSCRGKGLYVGTGSQRILLSDSRSDDRFKTGQRYITVIPIPGEEILVSELVEYKLARALSRSKDDGYPMFVNYWPELRFEMLERLRSVYRLLVTRWKVSLGVVVGTGIVEFWARSASGKGYSVEKEGDLFVIDLLG